MTETTWSRRRSTFARSLPPYLLRTRTASRRTSARSSSNALSSFPAATPGRTRSPASRLISSSASRPSPARLVEQFADKAAFLDLVERSSVPHPRTVAVGDARDLETIGDSELAGYFLSFQ